ncbi:MAG TPA: hypothetical protein VFN57_01560 [Thermomicrobiaceae bacterium]|nr:hypothetical protein [Thermomicrobiaceae bacterium]
MTISGSGAPGGGAVWTFWKPRATGQPCAPFTGGYAISGSDVGADGSFTAVSRTEPNIGGYPTIQGGRYLAAVGTAIALAGSTPFTVAIVSNVEGGLTGVQVLAYHGEP